MRRVLVADDDPDICGFVRRIIAKTIGSIQVIEVRNGAEALERLEDSYFELAILDVEMPYLTGLEVVKSVRRKGIETDIVILTGWATAEMARKAAKEGAQDFLEKPIIISELAGTLGHLLNKNKIR